MTDPRAFEEDKQTLLRLIHRLTHIPENLPCRPTPFLGRFPGRMWDACTGGIWIIIFGSLGYETTFLQNDYTLPY